MGDVKDLQVFKYAFELSMELFKISRMFPVEERYSLTSQIVRSSRAVCACLAEAYRKRQYTAHFVAKLSDADMENSETQVWLMFALECKYISEQQYNDLNAKSMRVGRMLSHMISYPEKFQAANRQPPTANKNQQLN
jgi:four helix bundle protein